MQSYHFWKIKTHIYAQAAFSMEGKRIPFSHKVFWLCNSNQSCHYCSFEKCFKNLNFIFLHNWKNFFCPAYQCCARPFPMNYALFNSCLLIHKKYCINEGSKDQLSWFKICFKIIVFFPHFRQFNFKYSGAYSRTKCFFLDIQWFSTHSLPTINFFLISSQSCLSWALR